MTPIATPTQSNSNNTMDVFLQLLTAQLRNQDPLSPMDSSDFAQQLATFSNVEQQIKATDKLEQIAGQLASAQFADAASMIGREVTVPTGGLRFEGQPVRFTGVLPDGADSGTVVIRDGSGEVIAQIAVSDNGPLEWSGQTADGSIAANGDYSAALRTLLSDGSAGPAGELVTDHQVEAVEFADNGIVVRLDNGQELSLSEVRRIK